MYASVFPLHATPITCLSALEEVSLNLLKCSSSESGKRRWRISHYKAPFDELDIWHKLTPCHFNKCSQSALYT